MRYVRITICAAIVIAIATTVHHKRGNLISDGAARAFAEPAPVHAEDSPEKKGDASNDSEKADAGDAGSDQAADEEAPSWVRHDKGGTRLELNAETQARIGLKVEAVQASELRPEIVAYGALEENPDESFTIRAPYSGYLVADAAAPWPRLGARVTSGDVLALIHARLTAIEMLDIQSRQSAAQGEMEESEAELAAARASFENKRKLNEQGKVVSDRAMEEAETKLRVDAARLASARERKALFDRLIENKDHPVATAPLLSGIEGEIVQVLAHPGEAVESGQPLLRVARLSHLIARIELPLGASADELTDVARVMAIGDDSRVIEATLMGRAPSVGTQTLGATLLLDVSVGSQGWRPGSPVAAHLTRGGPSRTGTVVPRGALLRFAGSTCVYVQTGDERFERRDVVPISPTAGGWFVETGLNPGERVVVVGAQVLLSEELKAQIELEAESEE